MKTGISYAGVRSTARRTLAAALAAIAALVVSLAFAGAANAQVNTTLDTLLSGGNNQGGITLGDKRYSNFTFSSSGDAPIAANGVNVSLTSTDNNNRYNLQFSFAREALASDAGETTDVVICYQVDVLGNQQINLVGLNFGTTVGTGSPGLAAASVTEQIFRGGPTGPEIGQMTVFNDGTGGLPDNTNDTLAVDPTATTLYFCKDILVSARPGGGRVEISTVDNFVNQVPEPGSAAFIAAAGAALLLRRRRA